MKRLVLTKISKAHNIAHIYEHLFVDELDRFFQNQELYRYLDYQIEGRAYFNGLVYLMVDLISKEAIALENEIPKIKVDIGENAINGVLWQVMAEKHSRLASTEGLIEKQLQILAKQAWVNIKDFSITNIAHNYLATENNDVDFIKTAAKNFKKLRCEFDLDGKWAHHNQVLVPLFIELTHVLSDNIAAMLAVDFYYFSTGPTCLYSSNTYREISNYCSHVEQNPKISDELEACKDCISELFKAGAVEKLVDQLHNVSYEPGSTAPDELKIFESTGFLIGKNGWQRIATIDNASQILNNVVLRIVYGNEKQELKIVF